MMITPIHYVMRMLIGHWKKWSITERNINFFSSIKNKRKNCITAEDSKETLDSFKVFTVTTYLEILSTGNNFSMFQFKFHRVNFVKTSFCMMIPMILQAVPNLIWFGWLWTFRTWAKTLKIILDFAYKKYSKTRLFRHS